MLIDIDSEEFDKAKEAKSKGNYQKDEAINYVMNINEILPYNLPPHRYAVAAYFLLKFKEMDLTLREIDSRPLFYDDGTELQGEPLFTLKNTDPEILKIGKKYLSYDIWQKLVNESRTISLETLENAAIFAPRPSTLGNEYITPPTLVELGRQVLNIKQGEKVADLCCGTGQFIITSGQEINGAEYTGFELDGEKYAIAKIKAEMLKMLNSTKSEIIQNDIFRNFLDNPNKKYDKIFSNYPFGIRVQGTEYSDNIDEYIKSSPENIELFSKNKVSSDWIFNKLIFDSLSENGKAVAIMTTGGAVNSSDINIRRFFIENNMIEAVINLPEKLFAEFAIPTTMIILGHNKTGKIRIVNGTNCFTPGRRLNYLSKENIEKIIKGLTGENSYSRDFTKEDFEKDKDIETSLENLTEDSSTNPKSKKAKESEYKLKLQDKVEEISYFFFENKKPNSMGFIKLKDLLNSPITRGAHFDASELDKMAKEADENGKDSYLQLKDIQNGIVSENLTKINISINSPESVTKNSKYKKYLIKDQNIVMSKNGFPYKVAFITVKEGERILAAGNFYILDVKKDDRINPKYLAAYLTSNQGQQALKNISTGTVMSTVSVANLNNLIIPCLPIPMQDEIIKEYEKNLNIIKDAREKLRNAEENIKHIFDLKEY